MKTAENLFQKGLNDDEIDRFKRHLTLNEIGYEGSISLRKDNQNIFVTDGGNYIYDLSIGIINEPNIIENLLNLIPGVFDNGLFINLTEKVIIGNQEGARIITK